MLITKCQEIFMKQPVFLELESPIAILGKYNIFNSNKKEIFMANTLTYFVFLNMEAIPPKAITFSLETMSTEANRALRLFLY